MYESESQFSCIRSLKLSVAQGILEIHLVALGDPKSRNFSFHAMRNSHARDTPQTSLHLVLLKSQNLFVDEKTLVLKGS